MKKVLCVAVLGALTLTPSFSQASAGGGISTAVIKVVKLDENRSRCYFKIYYVKTGNPISIYTIDIKEFSIPACEKLLK